MQSAFDGFEWEEKYCSSCKEIKIKAIHFTPTAYQCKTCVSAYHKKRHKAKGLDPKLKWSTFKVATRR